MIGFSNPFRFLLGIGFSNPFRFLWWKLWMFYYCWPFELQDDWNGAATAAAVPVIVSRLDQRLLVASLRGLLFPIVWTIVAEYNIEGISSKKDYCAGRAASALAGRADWKEKKNLSFIQQRWRGIQHALWKRRGSNQGPWLPKRSNIITTLHARWQDDWIQFNALHNGLPTDIEQAGWTEKSGPAGEEKHQVWYQQLWYLNNSDIRSCDQYMSWYQSSETVISGTIFGTQKSE